MSAVRRAVEAGRPLTLTLALPYHYCLLANFATAIPVILWNNTRSLVP